MAVTSGAETRPAPGGPAPRRAPAAGGALGLAKRFLTLREGSIIVVTLIALIYFLVSVSQFGTVSNFKTRSRSSRPARCS